MDDTVYADLSYCPSASSAGYARLREALAQLVALTASGAEISQPPATTSGEPVAGRRPPTARA